MNTKTLNLLCEKFQIETETAKFVEDAEESLKEIFKGFDEISEYNQYKVLSAFQKRKISDVHFAWNTGYGYDDAGRDALEKLYADAFGAEDGLVRTGMVNGTHAIASVYLGLLRPGDELLYCTGLPYDTMLSVIGLKENAPGNLSEYGISYKQADLLPGGFVDIEGVKKAIGPKTKIAALQRSRGYSFRNAISIDEIEAWVKACHGVKPDVICMVDNCYGEFTDLKEPTEVGADIMAGSLIKNPGGGLAAAGGYIVGKKDLVGIASSRVTCPGIGRECGLTFGQTRTMFQGFFIAPRVVCGAMKGAALCAEVFSRLGFDVSPKASGKRSDIVEAVKLGSSEAVRVFCEAVQEAAPVDSFVTPVPGDMPGYEDKIIMASGSFIAGSSIELSADAPIREPYTAYFQGGISYEHSKFGVIKAVQKLKDKKILKL